MCWRLLSRRLTQWILLPCRFSSYVAVPESKFVLKVPDSVSLDIACMLPCSGITTYNAVTTVKPVIEEIVNIEG